MMSTDFMGHGTSQLADLISMEEKREKLVFKQTLLYNFSIESKCFKLI